MTDPMPDPMPRLPVPVPTTRWTAYCGAHPISTRSQEALQDAIAEVQRYLGKQPC